MSDEHVANFQLLIPTIISIFFLLICNPLGCCKHITVSIAQAGNIYQKYEGLYIMEKSESINGFRIDEERSWEKYRPQSSDPEVSLRSLAPNKVGEWQFKDINGDVPVRSKPVSDLKDLKHCPTDYKEWQYWDINPQDVTLNTWKDLPDAKIICVTEATSSKYILIVIQKGTSLCSCLLSHDLPSHTKPQKQYHLYNNSRIGGFENLSFFESGILIFLLHPNSNQSQFM